MSEQKIGKITQVIGPVVDVEFEPGKLPNILNACFVTNPGINDKADNLVVEVAQHLGDNACRCIAMDVRYSDYRRWLKHRRPSNQSRQKTLLGFQSSPSQA